MRRGLRQRLMRLRDGNRRPAGCPFAEIPDAPETAGSLDSGAARAVPGPNDGGFTLLELLLVLVIFSLTIALASPYISSGLTGVTVRSTSKNVAAALRHARVLAMRDRQNYYARFTGKEVVIEPAKGAGGRKELPIPDDVKIEAGDGAVIVFYPGGGSSGGVFVVKGPMDRGGYTVVVEPSTGSVKTYPSNGTAPDGDGRT